jgi:hypothetical protein
MQVPGAFSTLSPSPRLGLHVASPSYEGKARIAPRSRSTRLTGDLLLPALAAALVAVPVFVQAPWVRFDPFGAAVFTIVLLTMGLALASAREERWQGIGALVVGFSGSWLGGSLFWGWFRIHPVMHLPIEAFALPLALAGLGGRWRIAGAFYLASLAGTASTDAAMALTGVIRFWPLVLNAPAEAAAELLSQAATAIFSPLSLLVLAAATAGLAWLGRHLWRQGPAGRVAAAAVVGTLAVDGIFLCAALVSPRLSGLI